uniref:NADH-ubiquinone oxidoreductase chain 4 n=1 Tax=Amblyomma javanense TaxID=1658007 RepID=A0A4Y5UCY9_9ACAR|nr:NADH dehydrogenase subunit 4 [Amblyomma javanense]QDC21274.1 NADH dehydrogenase subunit 4 [Amblyomma javanense]
MLMMIFMGFSILWLSFFFNSFEIMIMMLLMFLLTFVHILIPEIIIVINNLNLDSMSILLNLLTIWISFLMLLASMKMNFYNKNFMFYVSLMMLLLIICFSVTNLLLFYFFFESVLFPIIMMIFGWGIQPERLQAGMYMLMYTILGSFPLFVMIIFYMIKAYCLNYNYMDWISLDFFGNMFIFIMLGFFVKVPMFFFHLWLPKAHVEAPISGSMMLAGILLKLGIYGIFRFKMMIIFNMILFSEFFISISIWGSVMISIFCLYQIDIKSLIAYSSVCHMGVILGGLMSMNILSSMGALILMIGHGLCSSGLFCMANLIYERMNTRSMILFKGVKTIFPSLTLWWFMFSIVNMSAPLTMNLVGEFLLMMSILKLSMFFMFPIMLVIFLSACYSLYMYSYINHGQGWILWSSSLINLREYNLLFLHIFPSFFWILKMSMFCKWI